MAENKQNKIHHCFNCGEETEDYEFLPNEHKLYICGSKECQREFSAGYREMESEARQRANEDDYSRYY